MGLLLVADIGGTNGRFGLVTQSEDRNNPNYVADKQVTLKCSDHSDMSSLVKAACTALGVDIPAYACLAIAGPIEHGRVKITNLGWNFGIEELRVQLGMKALHVINDFASLAYGVPFLQEADSKVLYAAGQDPKAPICVMGPGTGFGMALLVPDQGSWRIIPTEGGHASFAPTNELELAIKAFLLKEQPHVSVENILSGMGLVNLYRAIAHIRGQEAQPYTPGDVGSKGVANEDPICREAVLTFLSILGEVAGDKAVSTGAKGGVVIGGGVTPKLMSLLSESNFEEGYKNKGPMRNYVSEISIKVIVNDKAALVGSAAWLIHNTDDLKPLI